MIFQDIDLNMRLFSHLIVMGIDISNQDLTYEKIFNNCIDATIIDMYPSIEKSKIPAYLENYKLWCFPEGLKIYNEDLKLINEDNLHTPDGNNLKEQNFETKRTEKNANFVSFEEIENKDQLHHFVMTDDQRVKRFCSALLFHEQYCVKSDQKYHKKEKISTLMPKISIQNLLKNPLKLNDNHDVIYIPKSISLISNLPIFEAQYTVLKYIYTNIIKGKRHKNKERLIKIPENLLLQFDDLYMNCHKKNLLDIIDDQWHKAMYSYDSYNGKMNTSSSSSSSLVIDTTRDYNNNNNNIHNSYHIKETQLLEFYISAFFSLLPIKTLSKETVLLKLYIDDINAITSISTSNPTTIINSNNNELLRYRINQTVGINLTGFNFLLIFKKLSLINIMRIIKFILLEKKIIIFSKNPGDIPNITETLMTLISPLTWMCIYIPYLPISMVDVVDSFMPYIIGMAKKYMKYVLENYDMSDTVVVDLDEDKIQAEERIYLPVRAKDYILDTMEVLLKQIKMLNQEKIQEISINFTLKCRQAFNIFFLQIINNYINYFNFNKREEGLTLPGLEIFKLNEYLKIIPKEDIPFMEIFCKHTMMFSRFLEESYELLYNCDIINFESWDEQTDEVSEFIKIIKRLYINQNLNNYLLNRDHNDYINIVNRSSNIKTIELIQNDQIKDAIYKYRNPERIDLMKYLVKYYYKFYYYENNYGQPTKHNQNTNARHNQNTNARHNHHYHPHENANYSSTQILRDIDINNINKSYLLFPKLMHHKIVDLNTMFKPKYERFSISNVNNSLDDLNKVNNLIMIDNNAHNIRSMQEVSNTFPHQDNNNTNNHNRLHPNRIENLLDPGQNTPTADLNNKLTIFSNPKPLHKIEEFKNPSVSNGNDDIVKYNDTVNNELKIIIPNTRKKTIICESQNSLASNPYEEPPINSPTSLRKQNYFLYYQFIKRNTIGEASPIHVKKKKIFDNSSRNSVEQQQPENVNMISASVVWGKMTNNGNNNDEESRKDKNAKDHSRNEIDDSMLRDAYSSQTNKISLISKNKQQEEKKLDCPMNDIKSLYHSSKQIWSPEVKVQAEIDSESPFHELGNNTIHVVAPKNKSLDDVSTTSSVNNNKSKRDMKKKHSRQFSTDLTKQQSNSQIQQANYNKDILDAEDLIINEFGEKIYFSPRRKAHMLINKASDNMIKANENKQVDPTTKRVIFEKLKSPIKRIGISDMSSLNHMHAVKKNVKPSWVDTQIITNSEKRNIKSYAEANRIALASSQFRGDQDESPEKLSPFEERVIRQEKIIDVNLSPFEDKLSNNVIPRKPSNFKSMTPSANNMKASHDNKAGFDDEMLMFVKNLDTGELVSIHDLNKSQNPNKKPRLPMSHSFSPHSQTNVNHLIPKTGDYNSKK